MLFVFTSKDVSENLTGTLHHSPDDDRAAIILKKKILSIAQKAV